ncbi:helix-turn-helix domain-containing protein [Dysgonomonas sp. 25]|uniref:helix-turn-helix domain-containing protein n=1 Tax=Dysgonomonas sp. 25 TaxID=2302933 RepID=UPI0013D0F15A|nr:helix-turn-helix domain-containing protein [Dysgonomonas sp. 25]NDV68818.1 DNA-binding protein [Dysgonomonas sp. 25]
MEIILTSADELRELINAAVVNAFEDAKLAEKQKAKTEEYLTRDQVCKILKISMSSLTRRVADGSMKCYKIGARSFFKASELNDVLIKLNK